MRKNLGRRRRARKLRVKNEARKWAKWEQVQDLRRGYTIGLFGERIFLS